MAEREPRETSNAMPPTAFAAKPSLTPYPAATPQAVAPMAGFRRVCLDALFPFVVDAWLQEQLIFFRRLTLLDRAGIPLHAALTSMLSTLRSARMKRIVEDAARTVADGRKLSESFARRPEYFTELQVELVRAGEAGGFLDRMLERVTVQVEKELELRRFLSRQTIYPKILLVVALVVIPVIFTFISGGDVLRALLDPLAGFLQLAILCAAIFAVGRTVLSRSPSAREVYEIAKWRLPGTGPVSRSYALARFGHALSGLYGAGVLISGALRIAGRASGSFRVSQMAELAAQVAEAGQPFPGPMRAAGFLPDNILSMLETGLETGEIDVMVSRAADYLEAEAETKAHQAAYIFSTIVYLLVACYIALTRILGVSFS